MPKGTVELRNASGELLGKIENIGAPAEGAEQFWKNYVPQYGDTRPRYVQVMESYADREVASLREQLEKWMRDYAIKTELLDEAEEQLAREKELHFAANGLKECFAKALENVKEQLAQAQRERDEYKAMLARLPDAMVEHLKHSLARTSGGGEK